MMKRILVHALMIAGSAASLAGGLVLMSAGAAAGF